MVGTEVMHWRMIGMVRVGRWLTAPKMEREGTPVVRKREILLREKVGSHLFL